MSNARNLANLLGTSTKANQVISTSGAITTTGAFTSVGIDDNASSNAITINTNGFVARPQTPCMSMTKNSSGQQQTISGTNFYVVTNLDSSYGNSHSVNNKSYFDSSTSRFQVPTGQPSGYYLCSFHTLLYRLF